MNRFFRNRHCSNSSLLTNSYIEFNQNSTNGLLADTVTQTDGQAGGRGLHTRRYLYFVKKPKKGDYS